MIKYSAWIKADNVRDGYAGVWWRVDGENEGRVLAFDNQVGGTIGGRAAPGNGVIRGATGTTTWMRCEIELPVASRATNINFGLLLTGTGTAWFDALAIELDGVKYADPQKFDFDFESAAAKGLFTGGSGYRVGIENSTSCSGRQSLKMQFGGDGGDAKPQTLSHP